MISCNIITVKERPGTFSYPWRNTRLCGSVISNLSVRWSCRQSLGYAGSCFPSLLSRDVPKGCLLSKNGAKLAEQSRPLSPCLHPALFKERLPPLLSLTSVLPDSLSCHLILGGHCSLEIHEPLKWWWRSVKRKGELLGLSCPSLCNLTCLNHHSDVKPTPRCFH